MTEDSTNNNHKYFCKNCRDRNWLIECACGVCGQVLSRTDERYRPRKFLYAHYHKKIRGMLHPQWTGGRTKVNNYWELNMPEYFSSNKNGKVREHIYFYQEYHKCCMLPWGHVHHKEPVTEDYCNNMPWNLQGMMEGKHITYHNTTTRVYKKKNTSGVWCSECGSNETYIRKNGSHHWLKDGKGGLKCHSCYGKKHKRRKRKVTTNQ